MGRQSALASVDQDSFRAFMGSYFTGVAVITSASGDRLHGLTCNSLTSVTLLPPTLLVCLNENSGTLAALRDRGGFVVNLLREGTDEVAALFASRAADRFERARWEPSPVLGLPWLADDTCAMAECVPTDAVTFGDHAVVFGRVVHAAGSAVSPLLYGRKRFAAAPVPGAEVGKVRR